MSYVRALENKDNRARGAAVIAALASLGISPLLQRRRWPRLTNIIAEFGKEPGPHPIFSAHYDSVNRSPGANDNASGVAALLGLCRELRDRQAPARVVFFDREEAWLRTPWLRLGLLGSLHYVWRSELKDVTAVYNVDMCGLGDFLGIWPVKRGEEALMPAAAAARRAADRVGLVSGLAHVPWYVLSSDHLPFRLRGMTNAVSLSLLPRESVPRMQALIARPGVRLMLSGSHRSLPEPFSLAHGTQDISSKMSEESLRSMVALLLELAR
ncbi:MAG: M28 family peptidase [Chloroflexi bacterium]|nr:M28 family peptidase [Chloroflexota bacterium]